MARQRKRPEAENPEIPMTPMIDVVFQLLIYFIVTMKPTDVVAHLDVFRPSADKSAQASAEQPKLIRIVVFPDGFSINDKPVSKVELDSLLMKLASMDRNQTIMITCGSLSPHENMIAVLDLCAKAGLKNLSVLSTD
ncbi:MAG: biopolymer transporter ExbD [Spartobacteria bacterium]|nr:biopolymer transporter ExbD [Spartobacteria bacterium]